MGRPVTPRKGLFAAWVMSTGETNQTIAKRIGCSAQAVANWRSGNARPGRAMANRIAEVSRGEVPVASWDRKRRAA